MAIVLGAIISLPFVTRALSAEAFGVYSTVTGFVAFLGFADLGVGMALTDRLGEASGRDDLPQQQSMASNAVVGAVVAAVLVLIGGVALTLIVPWQELLGSPTLPPGALQATVLCLVACTAISIVGSLGQRALYGLQQGSTANVWLVVASISGAVTVMVASLVAAPLWVFVLATVGSPALVSLLCTWWVFTRRFPQLRPRLGLVSRSGLRGLIGRSGLFFVIAVAAAIGYQTDSLVVSALLGAATAGVFNVAIRLFGLISQSLYPALLQLWPAFSEALGRGDSDWIRSRYRRSALLSSGLALAGGAVLVVIGPQLVSVWLTPDLAPPRSLLVLMAIWVAYSLGTAPFLFLLNAAGRVRLHTILATLVAVANIPLSILFTDLIGISGPILGSLVSHFLLAGIPSGIVSWRILRDLPATVPALKADESSGEA